MDTFLTLVIALGGIATGIGAIWAAMLARRQARLTERSLAEQRQFLKEQTEIARSQAQLTERSLAEQNERARLNLALDHVSRQADRFESPHFLSRRRVAAKFLLEHAFVDDGIVAMRQLHPALGEVANFFERMGYYYGLEVLPFEAVKKYGGWVEAYWRAFEPTIARIREEWPAPEAYRDWERLKQMVVDRSDSEALDEGHLRLFLEAESVVGEESFTTDI